MGPETKPDKPGYPAIDRKFRPTDWKDNPVSTSTTGSHTPDTVVTEGLNWGVHIFADHKGGPFASGQQGSSRALGSTMAAGHAHGPH